MSFRSGYAGEWNREREDWVRGGREMRVGRRREKRDKQVVARARHYADFKCELICLPSAAAEDASDRVN